jgi:D-serine dehydratase
MIADTSAPPLTTRENFRLDDRIRGVPPGAATFDADSIAAERWHPAGGHMSLPVLTLDEAAFAANRDLFLRYAREQGVEVAPHAKTPMAPDLAHSLVEAGAWGTTVADVRQASVMLRAGLKRLILANEVGGIGGARRLAALLAAFPAAELYTFADSVAAAMALATAWQEIPRCRHCACWSRPARHVPAPGPRPRRRPWPTRSRHRADACCLPA